jgi:hypothetical protein
MAALWENACERAEVLLNVLSARFEVSAWKNLISRKIEMLTSTDPSLRTLLGAFGSSMGTRGRALPPSVLEAEDNLMLVTVPALRIRYGTIQRFLGPGSGKRPSCWSERVANLRRRVVLQSGVNLVWSTWVRQFRDDVECRRLSMDSNRCFRQEQFLKVKRSMPSPKVAINQALLNRGQV